MLVRIAGFIFLFVVIRYARADNINSRPIVGIVGMRITDVAVLEAYPHLQGKNYIAASYVKFIEMGGARVVPISPELNDTALEDLFHSVNGLLLPGGEVNLETSGYFNTTKRLFKMALIANKNGDFFPILGICRGMQALTVHLYGSLGTLSLTDARNYTTSLKWNKTQLTNSLFSELPRELMSATEHFNITSHFHKYGITMKTYEKLTKLRRTYRVLATSYDRNHLNFISVLEGRLLPFYGVQFHPEKTVFEWAETVQIPHSRSATQFAQYISNAFVDRVRRNTKHKFTNKQVELDHLIYNLKILNTAHLSGHSPFMQMYVF